MQQTKSAQIFTNNIIKSLVVIGVGILFAVFKTGVFQILLTVLGALMFLIGVGDVIRKVKLWEGIIEMVVGALVIVGVWTLFEVASLVVGIGMLMAGSVGLVGFVKHRRKVKTSPVEFVGTIVLLVLGALLVAGYAAKLLDVLLLVSGILLIAWGVVYFITAIFHLTHAEKEYTKRANSADSGDNADENDK